MFVSNATLDLLANNLKNGYISTKAFPPESSLSPRLRDNELIREEATDIMKVAERLGIDAEELAEFDGGEPELHLPDRQYKLYAVFHRLVMVIMIDNVANEVEKKYCFDLGIKMGLHPNAVIEVIQYVVKEGPFEAVPAEILAIFRKYLS